MRQLFEPAVRAALILCLACGIVYPITVLALAQIFPFQANGSIVRARDGTIIGSQLIGQAWSAPQWFHGRPSATSDPPYNPLASNGSNLGPTNPSLAQRLATDRRALELQDPGVAGGPLPADMITASGSGLDPDITIANALLQIPRIARARHAPVAQLQSLVARHTRGRALGVFGEPRVNVLELNLALEGTR